MNRLTCKPTLLPLTILLFSWTIVTIHVFNRQSSNMIKIRLDLLRRIRPMDRKDLTGVDHPGEVNKGLHVPKRDSKIETRQEAFRFTIDDASNVCRRVLNRRGARASIGVEEECQHYLMEFPAAWMELFEKIKSYVTWHNHTYHMVRKRLDDGDNMTNVLGDLRTLTYRCKNWPRCAGYGDQAQKTARGFLLAMLTKRFFTVEWPHNFNGSDKWVEVLTPTVLNWKMDPPFSSELLQPNMSANCILSKGTDVADYAYSTHYRHVYYYMLNIPDILCRDVSHIDMELQHIVYFCKEARRDHYIEQPNRIFFIYGLIHRLMYRFSDGVIERGEKRLKEFGLLYSPFVAVHIRTALEETSLTDKKQQYYTKIARHQRDQTSWRRFINCGESAASRYSIDRPLLLFSDSSICLKWASQRYPLSRVTYSNSSFWHFTEHAELKESKEIVDKILDTMSDLYLISKATVVVKGISLFTNLGMYLGSISNSNVVRCDIQSKNIFQKRLNARHVL